MRSLWRTVDRVLLRDILAISLAVGFVGMSYGAIAVATGVPAWAVVAMSVIVFAGGSQFLVIGMFAFGNPVAAIVGGLLLNARHLPYGMAVADVLTGICLFACWQVGTVLGIGGDNAVGDPNRFGLDAAFPAALLALLLPRLAESAAARVALVGATVAVVATFFAPAGRHRADREAPVLNSQAAAPTGGA